MLHDAPHPPHGQMHVAQEHPGALRMPGAEGSLSPQPGVQLHFVEMGHGPAICLCHGFPESWLSWRYQVRRWGNRMVMLTW